MKDDERDCEKTQKIQIPSEGNEWLNSIFLKVWTGRDMQDDRRDS